MTQKRENKDTADKSKAASANVGIIGVGLIGASLALALRRGGYTGEIRGYDIAAVPGGADVAGAVTGDGGIRLPQEDTIERLCEVSDVLVLATPPGEFGSCIERLIPKWTPDKVLTDVGSIKGDVVAQVRRLFGQPPPGFVPGHPIAGSEKSTAAAARADLFAGAKVILTPLEETSPEAYATVCELWKITGAQIEQMDYTTHDEIFAMVSHLPHVVAYALVNCVVAHDGDMVDEYAAGGFRDYTRVARSSPEMWRDICLANRDNLIRALRLYAAEIRDIIAKIENDDGSALHAYFTRAQREFTTD